MARPYNQAGTRELRTSESYDPTNAVVSKTTAYTFTLDDSGRLFDNTGAAGSVTFTLPAASTMKGFFCEIHGVVDQAIVLSCATSGQLVGPNNASRDSYTSGASGQRIGVTHYVSCNGAKWFVGLSMLGLTQGTFA